MRKLLVIILMIVALTSVSASAGEDVQLHPKLAFAWGADAGASVDLTGSDMSDVNFSAYFGMARGWLNFVGIGAQAAVATSNSCRSYDIFAALHTNFVNRPTLFFWPVRFGLSLNYLEHNHQQSGLYAFTGVGVNLARGKTYCSYLEVGYTYRGRKPIVGELTHNFKYLHFATVKIGISF